MTRPVSIFLKTTTALDVVAALLEKLVGHALVREEPDVGTIYRTYLLCIELCLADDHGLEDDGAILFTEFDLQLKLIPLRAGEPLASYDPFYDGLAAFLAEKLSMELSCR